MKKEIIYNENDEGRVVKIYLRLNDEKDEEGLFSIRPNVSFVMGIEINHDAVEGTGAIYKNKVVKEDSFVMLGTEYEEFLRKLKTKKKNTNLKIEDHLQDTDSFVSLKILDDKKVWVKASYREYIGEPIPNVTIELEVKDTILDKLYNALTTHTQF